MNFQKHDADQNVATTQALSWRYGNKVSFVLRTNSRSSLMNCPIILRADVNTVQISNNSNGIIDTTLTASEILGDCNDCN